MSPNAIVSAAGIDIAKQDFEKELRSLRPDIVVHTAGPFQGQDYRVAEACIKCRSHYIDLADGREFVQGFDRLHVMAEQNGVLLVSGASTLPGLSSAVVDVFKGRFDSIRDIEISIAPAHRTPRGTSTIAAVLSYCGKPFKVLERGDWTVRHGWQDMRIQHHPKLGTRLSGACDVPDLALLPDYAAVTDSVTFHAALESKLEQIALWLMGWITRLRIIKDWNRHIPLFAWLSGRFKNFGSDIGGMHVKLSGIDHDQSSKSVTWYLTARQNHGPEIPCSPALILTRKLAADRISTRGAFPCMGMITLTEFDTEVSDLDIDWFIDETA